MGIFDKIKDAIFGHAANAAPMPGTAAGQPSASAPVSPTQASPAPATPSATPASAAPSAGPSAGSTAAGSTASAPVDIVPILDAAVKKNGQHLNWRTSIVDLMKALDLDSSLASRKELATELHYTGDTNDSATMNVWLHKALMKKLGENGGKVPADLAD